MPASALTAEGFAFDPTPLVWHLGASAGPRCFDFASLPGITDRLRDGVMSAVLAMLRDRSTFAVHSAFERIRYLVRDASSGSLEPLEALTLAQVDAFVRRIPSERSYMANELRYALRAWVRTGVGGLSEDLVEGLESIRGEPFVMGKATRTCSASEGALSDADVARLVGALLAAREAGTVSLRDCCLCLVSATFGPRSSEIAALKACDLREYREGGDVLMLPTAKQRDLRIRGWMRDAILGPSLMSLLRLQRDEAAGLGAAAGLADPLQAPLFQRGRLLRNATKDSYLEGLEGHMSSRIVSGIVRRTCDGLGVLDHLGEGNGRVFPLRLRRSYATSRFTAGASLEEIAWELGHSGGSQHAITYVEATPAIVRGIDAALGGRMDGFFASFGLDHPDPELRPRFGGRSA